MNNYICRNKVPCTIQIWGIPEQFESFSMTLIVMIDFFNVQHL
jgi:hypothetical protein